jgi:hypothetical protein
MSDTFRLTVIRHGGNLKRSVFTLPIDLVRHCWLGIVLCACLVFGQDKKRTIYVDRMEDLAPYVEKALIDAELPFEFIEEEKRPELKAELKRLHAAYGEILYKQKFGQNETHRLELRNVETNSSRAARVRAGAGSREGRPTPASFPFRWLTVAGRVCVRIY